MVQIKKMKALYYTVKLGNKELFDKEQIGIKDQFAIYFKVLLALRNNFRATKKLLIAKFDNIITRRFWGPELSVMPEGEKHWGCQY